MIELKETTEDYLRAIAADMRAMDAEECRLTGGHTPIEALEYSLKESDFSFTALCNGVPMLVFGGVYDATGVSGTIWALGTNECFRHPVAMVRWGREIAKVFLELGERWTNTVLDDYAQCLKFLSMIGFEIDGDSFPFNGRRFRRVVLRRGYV